MIQIYAYGREWVRQIGEKIAQYLLRNRINVTYKYNSKPTEILLGSDKTELFKKIVITKDSFNYIIDFDDSDECQVANYKAVTKVLKCQYNPNREYWSKVIPYTYFPRNPDMLQSMLNDLRSSKTKQYPLYFRGQPNGKRAAVLSYLKYCTDLPDELTLDNKAYYQDVSLATICLSLPGHGNCCHREIECFGIGVPVLMPRMVNIFNSKLIPDQHYILVDCDYYSDDAQIIAARIVDRYNKCKDDHRLLTTVRTAAMKWYEMNVMFPSSIRLALKLCDLI